MRNATRRLLPFLLLVVVPGCDGAPEAPSSSPETAPPVDAPVSDAMGLAADELTGLEEANVVFALPWVAGPVNREPTAGTEPVPLAGVSALSDDLFDRLVFEFGEGSLPGYHLEWVAGAPQACGSDEALALGGSHVLRLRLGPITGSPPAAPAAPEGSGIAGLVLSCETGGEMEWHLGLAERSQIRVVEMRSPPRLVVDLRKPGTGGS